jgi:hypothetical protein
MDSDTDWDTNRWGKYPNSSMWIDVRPARQVVRVATPSGPRLFSLIQVERGCCHQRCSENGAQKGKQKGKKAAGRHTAATGNEEEKDIASMDVTGTALHLL